MGSVDSRNPTETPRVREEALQQIIINRQHHILWWGDFTLCGQKSRWFWWLGRPVIRTARSNCGTCEWWARSGAGAAIRM